MLRYLKQNQTIIRLYKLLLTTFFELLTLISPQLSTKSRYRATFGKRLDLTNPTTLNEKILWLKLNNYSKNSLVIQCGDKYRVREYVTDCGCSKLLIPLYSVFNRADEIVWSELPRSFALKWNFGAGMNIICHNKFEVDEKIVISKLRRWGKKRYWLSHAEMHYKFMPKKLLCEQLLFNLDDALQAKNSSWIAPEDYKIYCFNGEPMFVMVCIGRGQQDNVKFLYYDRAWNLLPYSQDALDDPHLKVDAPECLDDLFYYASLLSQPFPFVRADFYCIDNHVFFGELTFTPSAGFDSTRLPDVDALFGQLVKLDYEPPVMHHVKMPTKFL